MSDWGDFALERESLDVLFPVGFLLYGFSTAIMLLELQARGCLDSAKDMVGHFSEVLGRCS